MMSSDEESDELEVLRPSGEAGEPGKETEEEESEEHVEEDQSSGEEEETGNAARGDHELLEAFLQAPPLITLRPHVHMEPQVSVLR